VVVDTSALIAILFGEPASPGLLEKIDRDEVRAASCATLLEASIVVAARKGGHGLPRLDALVKSLGLTAHPVDETQAKLARHGFLAFGKGRHPAALNYGDSFSYALAKHLGEPLLFIGDDFSKTDVAIA
jgi:ribonuclease VapC